MCTSGGCSHLESVVDRATIEMRGLVRQRAHARCPLPRSSSLPRCGAAISTGQHARHHASQRGFRAAQARHVSTAAASPYAAASLRGLWARSR